MQKTTQWMVGGNSHRELTENFLKWLRGTMLTKSASAGPVCPPFSHCLNRMQKEGRKKEFSHEDSKSAFFTAVHKENK